MPTKKTWKNSKERSNVTLLFLRSRYPTLRTFIKACFDAGELDKLWDFMFALETDETRRDS